MKDNDVTPEQVRRIREIELDKWSARQTLDAALQYHSNCVAHCNKRSREWWDEVIKQNGLDPSKRYTIDDSSGFSKIVEVIEE